MKICYVECETRLHGDVTCAASLVEATSSTYEQKFEYWATVVVQFVFQYMTRINSNTHFNLYLNLWSLCTFHFIPVYSPPHTVPSADTKFIQLCIRRIWQMNGKLQLIKCVSYFIYIQRMNLTYVDQTTWPILCISQGVRWPTVKPVGWTDLLLHLIYMK
jgi:hypothetical protein